MFIKHKLCNNYKRSCQRNPEYIKGQEFYEPLLYVHRIWGILVSPHLIHTKEIIIT